MVQLLFAYHLTSSRKYFLPAWSGPLGAGPGDCRRPFARWGPGWWGGWASGPGDSWLGVEEGEGGRLGGVLSRTSKMEGFSRSEPRRGVGRLERWTDCGRVSGALPPTFTREETGALRIRSAAGGRISVWGCPAPDLTHLPVQSPGLPP